MVCQNCVLAREPSNLVTPCIHVLCVYALRPLFSFFGTRSGFFMKDRIATLLNNKHSRTRFRSQIALFLWHLCIGREARADNHTYAKRTIIRKNLQAKFKYIRIEHTRQKKQNQKK